MARADAPPELWTQEAAMKLCREIEMIAPLHGAHVALTGGCLYKAGPRKDLDLVFYRIRQANKIDSNALFEELNRRLGLVIIRYCNAWCVKAMTAAGWPIDIFFPEENRHGESAFFDDTDTFSSGDALF